MTNASVLARTRSTLVDVFLAVKARKSHLTITAGKEKSLTLIFCLRWKKKKKINLFPTSIYTEREKKIIVLLMILITHYSVIAH